MVVIITVVTVVALATWLPVLLEPDTEKDWGLGLMVSAQAVYSIPQKFLSILTHML